MSLPTTASSQPTLSAQTFMPLLYAIAVPIPVVLAALGGILITCRCIRARRRKAQEEAAEQLNDVEMGPVAPVAPPDQITVTRPSTDGDEDTLFHAWHGSARVNGRVSTSGLTVPLPAKFAAWRSGPLPEPTLPSLLPQKKSRDSDVSSLELDESWPLKGGSA